MQGHFFFKWVRLGYIGGWGRAPAARQDRGPSAAARQARGPSAAARGPVVIISMSSAPNLYLSNFR